MKVKTNLRARDSQMPTNRAVLAFFGVRPREAKAMILMLSNDTIRFISTTCSSVDIASPYRSINTAGHSSPIQIYVQEIVNISCTCRKIMV